MAVAAGTRIGNYEIVAPLGAGGMGEVYRARDSRLDRDVALKILPEAVARDPDRTARFAREARTLAALNHPHIAQLYGFEEAGEIRSLVMELVEGEDLSQIIARGPLALDEALPIARQIAEALEAAHEAGIVHRDLKPANIKVRPDGTVKVLDFGLAKAMEPAIASAGDQLASPTITSPAQMTRAGVILGTAAYMSPEQARGRVVDRRTDVWAFGCVLFEMLTGVRAFAGEDVTETLAAIMKSDPAMVRLPADTPVEVRRLLTRCLQKDRRLRLQHIGDARLELDDAAHPASTAATPAAPVRPGWHFWAGAAAIALAAVVAGAWLSEWRHASEPIESLQFAIAPPPQTTFATPAGGGTGVAPQLAISPDGKTVVFVVDSGKVFQLWQRSLRAVDAKLLPGTDGAAFPFWSPDGQSVGFFADGKLKRIRIDGGPPSVVCDAPLGRGGTWNSNNVIVFSPSSNGPLQRVSATAGGIPQDISTLDTTYGETNHRFPSFLPDGTHFLYSATVGTCCPAAKPGRIKIGVLDETATETLTNVESSVAFGGGHLLFADPSSGTLMAQPFDATTRKLAGEAFPVVTELATEGSRYASFSVSSNGLLIHGSGARRILSQLTWFDRSGRQLGTVGDAGVVQNMSLAPDDRRAAFTRIDPQSANRDVWVIDSATNAESRVSFDAGEDDAPAWTLRGDRVLYVGQRTDSWSIISRAPVAVEKEQVLFAHKGLFRDSLYVNDVSADGTLVLLQLRGSLGASNLWVLRAGTTTPVPYSKSTAFEVDAAFSPDGKWVAYQSNDAGQRANVYVQPYPATGGTVQISRDVGFKPMWRSDGKELFFLSEQEMMAVPIDTVNGFHAGAPRRLFPVALLGRSANAGRQYGVTRDGQKFLMNLPQQEPKPQILTVTTNWLAAARR